MYIIRHGEAFLGSKDMLSRTTTPPIYYDGAELVTLIPVDYFQALEPAFRIYSRICFMMLSVVRQVRRFGPPLEVFAQFAIWAVKENLSANNSRANFD